MENEILQQILAELKDLKQGQAKLEQGQNELRADVATLKKDVAALKEDVEIIKEDVRITRSATNTLLEWAEEAQIEVKIPLYKKAN